MIYLNARSKDIKNIMFLNYQLDYLLWLQNLRDLTNDVLTPFFLAVTHFGELLIPLSFIALIYWSLNRKVGEFLLLNLSFTFLFNQLAKMLFCINRPWILSDKIKPVPDALPMATGYSFPSGHTARAIAVWGGLVVKLWDNKAVRYTLTGLILLIAFSRNYLGVHTPQDVLVSLISGIFILLGTKILFDKMEENENLDTKIFLPGMFITIFVILIITFKPYFTGISDTFINSDPNMDSFFKHTGSILGAISGWYICRKYVPFTTNNISALKRIFRFLPGFIILLLIMFFTKKILVADFGINKGSFIYGALISTYVTLFYPWIFSKTEKFFDIDVLEKLWFWKKN